MNKSLLQDIETLAGKAGKSEMGHEAKNYAEAALALVQATCALRYAETQTPSVGVGIAQEPEGGTD